MTTIQELEEQYKIDEKLLVPLQDTSNECYGECHREKTKEVIKKYKERLAELFKIKNETILKLLDNTTQENCGIVLTIYTQMQFLQDKDLDVIIEFVKYIKSERI